MPATTADRLRQIMDEQQLKQADILRKAQPYCQQYRIKLGKSDLSQFLSGKVKPGQWKLTVLSLALNVSETWLMGLDVPRDRTGGPLQAVNFVSLNSPEPVQTFHDTSSEQIAPLVSVEELDHIKKYRILDEHGRRVVDSSLNLEYDRMTHIEDREQEESITYLSCYDLAVSAGPAGEPWEQNNYRKTRMEIPTEQVPENAHFCIRVNGDSMEPAYKDGDIAFVQRQDEMVREGEIGVFLFNGSGYMKRLGDHQLVSLNPDYEPIPVHDYDQFICQGRVLGKV